ncbi:VanW family protein [Parvimonas micra]|uniref:VanW family protein n=1 Tax=Parvimonas micra TaxID=33033 RepID=UPI0030D1F18F
MKKYIKIFAILGIFLIGTISGYILLNRNPLSNAKGYTKNLKREELLTYDKIYEGIYINNIDLKDLTKEEAIEKIKQSLEISNEFTLKHDSYTKKFVPKDIDFSYDYEKLVNEAFNIGRSGSDDERIETLKNLLKNPKKYDIKSTFDLSKLNSIITEISEKINSEPIDEKFSFSEGKISVVDGKVGLKVESEKILDNFNTVPVKFDLEIPTIVTEYKKIDKTLLSSVKGVIGEATTKFDNQPNRNNNIKIAANKINEFVVNPGETFSFSKELGEVSKNTGYKPAGTFINSKIVDSIGGGICQVSSTLYQALVKSDLKIVERNQHSMRVPYCTIGLDAMYYEGF